MMCPQSGVITRKRVENNTISPSQAGEASEKGVVASVLDDVGDAVGVPGGERKSPEPASESPAAGPPRKWFVAMVGHNTEKAVRDRLAGDGREVYVASQMVVRVWRNGRRAKVEKVLIPSHVFVRCTERERRELVTLPFIRRFLTDRAGATTGGTKPLAVIPQREIDKLRFMLGQSDIPVTLTEAPYKEGDRIVVARGSLSGLEGEVMRTVDGKSEVIVRLDILGAARVSINSSDLEKADLKSNH